MKMIYKGQVIEPFESFYRSASERFFHGTMGGQLSRCVKCDDDLTIMEVVYEDNSSD